MYYPKPICTVPRFTHNEVFKLPIYIPESAPYSIHTASWICRNFTPLFTQSSRTVTEIFPLKFALRIPGNLLGLSLKIEKFVRSPSGFGRGLKSKLLRSRWKLKFCRPVDTWRWTGLSWTPRGTTRSWPIVDTPPSRSRQRSTPRSSRAWPVG